MTKSQPREPDLVRSHLAVQHTEAMFNHIRSSLIAEATRETINRNRFMAAAVRGLQHLHRKSLPAVLHYLSIQLHQAHLALAWQCQMVTNIQGARFHLIYQRLRAQTKASEQWEEVHQVSDLMVKLLDVTSKDKSSETWHSCAETDPAIAVKVKLAARRHRQKAKEAIRKAVQAAEAEVHLHAPIGGYSGMQQRAKLQAWQVTPNPEAVLGRHPVTNSSESMVDLHDIDTRVTKDLNWTLGQAKAQINRPASHYRKRYRPGRHSYNQQSPAPPVLTAAAISLCFVAALLNPALGTSALATATAVVGLQRARQQIQARRHKTATAQLPQTVPLSHHYDSLRDQACPERNKNNQNIAQWEQQNAHHQVQWSNAEQQANDFEIAALASTGTTAEEATAEITPQLMMAQAKRARFMATCAEAILVDEGDEQITA